MQYLITAFDGTDPDALSRRLATRQAHISVGDKYRSSGNHLYAAAILNDNGQMIGSSMVVEFNSRDELDNWLKEEPYITEKVWDKIDIRPCKVGKSFERNEKAHL